MDQKADGEMIFGDAYYDGIILTEEEVKAALLEGRKKKYYRETHKPYWDEQEAKNSSTRRPKVVDKDVTKS